MAGVAELGMALEEDIGLAVLQSLLVADPHAVERADDKGNLPLHLAIRRGAGLETVTFLLNAYPAGALHGLSGSTALPLHLAASLKSAPGIVDALLAVGSDSATRVDSQGRLALHAAVSTHAPLPVVESLLAANPAGTQHPDDNGLLPLHAAAANQAELPVVQALLQANPLSAQRPDNDKFLPLHRAVAKHASTSVVLALLEAYPGAIEWKDSDGLTPLHIAAERGITLEVVRLLLEAQPEIVKQPDDDGFLPLHLAVLQGAAAQVVRLLVNSFPGALLLRELKDGMAPLHIAVTRAQSLPLVPVLLETQRTTEDEWPDPTAVTDSTGNLPLYLAAGFVDDLQEDMLLQIVAANPSAAAARAGDRGGLANEGVYCDSCGADIPVGHRRYGSRLYSDFDICHKCMTLGPAQSKGFWNMEDMQLVQYGDLPLHRALTSGASLRAVQALMSAYPSALQTRNHEGYLPLQVAARRAKSAEVLRTILGESQPEAVREVDHLGNSPLHHACSHTRADPDIVALLLEAAPEAITVLNNTGQSPLSLAVDSNAPEPVIRQLLDAQASHLDPAAHRISIPAHALVQQPQYKGIVETLLKDLWDIGLWRDSMDRAVVDLAHPDVKASLLTAACLARRYDLGVGRCIHESSTSLVLSAIDYGAQPPKQVVLKFMTSVQSLKRELSMRVGLDSKYVIMPSQAILDASAEAMFERDGGVGMEVIRRTGLHAELCQLSDRQRTHDIARSVFPEFSRLSSLKDKSNNEKQEYTCCLVMELADRTLKDVLVHNQELAGRNYGLVKHLLTSVVECMQHLFEHGITHCDLKPHNVVQTADLCWKVLDFDCSRAEGDSYVSGKRPSSGVCPPEVNHSYVSEDEDALRSHHVSYAHDLWSLGVLAFRLCHGRGGQLWKVNEYDEMVSTAELQRACRCNPADIHMALRKISNNSAWQLPAGLGGFDAAAAAEALLVKLLELDPEIRRQHFRKPSAVLSEAFFTNESATTVQLSQLQKSVDALRSDVRHLRVAVEISSNQLAGSVASLLREQHNSTRTILNTVVSHSQNACPSVFGIAPYAWRNEFMWRSSGDDGMDANGQLKWKTVIFRMVTALSDPKLSAKEVLKDAVHDRFILRLVCEGCHRPQGSGYIINKPGELADDVLLLLRTSLRAISVAKVGLGVAKCFLPFLPTVPDGVNDQILQVCSLLEGSDGTDYISNPEGGNVSKLGHAMRVWIQFLEERDPHHEWGQLSKVVLDGSHADVGTAGMAIWVCSDCLLGAQPKHARAPSRLGTSLVVPSSALPAHQHKDLSHLASGGDFMQSGANAAGCSDRSHHVPQTDRSQQHYSKLCSIQ